MQRPQSSGFFSVQAQVLNLIADLKHRLDLSPLFITHDPRVAAQVCDRIAVMQRGEIVYMGPTEEIFARPQHAYTRNLLSSIPGVSWSLRSASEPANA